jgi:Peptidase_C39 like family
MAPPKRFDTKILSAHQHLSKRAALQLGRRNLTGDRMAQMQIPVGRRHDIMPAAPPSLDPTFLRALTSAQNAKPQNDGRGDSQGRPAGQIREFSQKQRFEKTCGAAALFCAAQEIGVYPHTTNLRHAKNIEADLYRRMEELAEVPGPGGSTPISIARAAKTMTMESTISLSKTSKPRIDNPRHATLAQSAGPHGIRILSRQPRTPPLDNTSRRLLMVCLTHDGVDEPTGHALLERPDKSVMNPTDGSNHQSLAHYNRALARRGMHYRSLGIAIDLTRRG